MEELIRLYFAQGIARSTMTTYSSAQRRYLSFCEQYQISPLPLSESSVCLFAAFLVQKGLRAQSISTYLSALRHLQISAGLHPPQRSEWPRLQYMLKGIARVQSTTSQRRLPVTPAIMRKLQEVCMSGQLSNFESRLLWAACCLGYFGFLRSGEFTLPHPSSPPAILASDLAVDSHSSPSMVQVRLRRAKTDPFGQGVLIYVGKTGTPLCPVTALLNFMAVRPRGNGPLFVHDDGSPLTRDQFVRMTKHALQLAKMETAGYSGHSFRIGAATAAAAAGVPPYFIKMLGRWQSEAYHTYIRTPRESLASISQLLA